MTSWMFFNCASVNCECPHLFAGRWKQYSTKAISQLMTITFPRGEHSYFKRPYHAIVIKIFETESRITVLVVSILPRRICRFRLRILLHLQFQAEAFSPPRPQVPLHRHPSMFQLSSSPLSGCRISYPAGVLRPLQR